jgi:hypothetical protein
MEMISEFKAELDAITRDSPIRVVVIAGNGSAFSGGLDLKEMMANRTQDFVGGVRAVQPRDTGDAGDAANRDRPRAWHCHGRRAARSWPLAISRSPRPTRRSPVRALILDSTALRLARRWRLIDSKALA